MNKRLVVAAAMVLAAANSTSAWAGWGCGFNSKQGIGRVWGADDEQQARTNAFHNCADGHLTDCRIISCSANVDDQADADKIWPRTKGIKYKPWGCGGAGEPAC